MTTPSDREALAFKAAYSAILEETSAAPQWDELHRLAMNGMDLPIVREDAASVRPRWWRGPVAVAVAAAAILLVAIGLPILLFGGGTTVEMVTEPTAASTTLAPTTTSAAPTTMTAPIVPSTGEAGWERVGTGATASTFELYGVAPLADRWIAVGGTVGEKGRASGAVLASVDGVEWVRVAEDQEALTSGSVFLFGGVTATESGIVAFGGECQEEGPCLRPSIWHSSDGDAWELVSHDPVMFGSQGWIADGVATDTGVLAVGMRFDDGESGFAPAVWSSPDGRTWTLDWTGAVQPVFENQGMAIINGNGFSPIEAVTVTTEGNLVAVGSACDVSEAQYECTAAVWVSTDGTDWSRAPHDPAVFASETPGGQTVMTGIAAIDETLIAVGTDNGTAAVAWTSRDGVTWTRLDLPQEMEQTAELSVIATTADGFLAAGPGWAGAPNQPTAIAWVSSDGSKWTVWHEFGPGIVTAISSDGTGGIVVGSDPSDETGAIWVAR